MHFAKTTSDSHTRFFQILNGLALFTTFVVVFLITDYNCHIICKKLFKILPPAWILGVKAVN